MIVLDTDVLSETLRPNPDSAVMAWLAARPAASLFTTTFTRGEILYGVRVLPKGRRRDRLHDAITTIFVEAFAGRILDFDSPSADAYADIAVTRKQSGRPIGQFDAMIAAVTRSRGAVLATRNTKDFTGCGIELVDPWTAGNLSYP